MLTIHHLNNSRSQRIIWFLEELELPYTIKHYQRDGKTMLAPAELKQIHPLGKAPILTDDDTTIAESAVILEYLAQTYGKEHWTATTGSKQAQRISYWLHYAEGSAMPPLLMKLVFDRIEKAPLPFFIKPVAKKISDIVNSVFIGPQLKTHMAYLEHELGQYPWFAGEEFTIADIQMGFVMEVLQSRGGLNQDYPNCLAWLKKIQQRPAYIRAMEQSHAKP